MAVSTGSVAGQRAVNPLTPSGVRELPAVKDAQVNKINGLLAGSPMAGTGADFVNAGNANNVDPYFLLAIAKHESNYGRLGFARNGSHNPFGLGVTGAPGAGFHYSSWGDAINAAARNLSGSLYAGAGLITIEQVGGRWAADKNWANAVARYYNGFTGQGSVKTTVLGPTRSVPQGTDTDVAGRIGNLVSDPIAGLVDVVKFIADPGTWLRIGEMAVGVIGMVVGAVMFTRGKESAKAIGLMLAGFGFLWLWAGIKAMNPAELLKAIVGNNG